MAAVQTVLKKKTEGGERDSRKLSGEEKFG